MLKVDCPRGLWDTFGTDEELGREPAVEDGSSTKAPSICVDNMRRQSSVRSSRMQIPTLKMTDSASSLRRDGASSLAGRTSTKQSSVRSSSTSGGSVRLGGGSRKTLSVGAPPSVSELEDDEGLRELQADVRMGLFDARTQAILEEYLQAVEERKQVKDEMEMVSKENRDLSKSLAVLKVKANQSRDANDIVRNVKGLEAKLERLKKDFDVQNFDRKKKQKKYAELRQQHDMVMAESVPSAEQTRLRALQNRLDKMSVKFNEVTLIRRTYDRILQRLENEKVGYEAKLSAIQGTLQAKVNDLQELNADYVKALKSKQKVLGEFSQFRSYHQAEISRLKSEYNEKYSYFLQEEHLRIAMENREQQRKLIQAEAGASVDSPMRQQNLKMQYMRGLVKNVVEDWKDKKMHDVLDDYVERDMKIRKAMGVTSITDVPGRLSEQAQAEKNMIKETKDVERKLYFRKQILQELREELQRYVGISAEKEENGDGPTEQVGRSRSELLVGKPLSARSRKTFTTVEGRLVETEHRVRVWHEKCDKMYESINNVRLGISHLMERACRPTDLKLNDSEQSARDTAHDAIERLQEIRIEDSPDTAEEVMQEALRKLDGFLQALLQALNCSSTEQLRHMLDEHRGSSQDLIEKATKELSKTNSRNFRLNPVILHQIEGEDTETSGLDSEEDESPNASRLLAARRSLISQGSSTRLASSGVDEFGEPIVLDRRSIKRQSMNIVRARERRGKRKSESRGRLSRPNRVL